MTKQIKQKEVEKNLIIENSKYGKKFTRLERELYTLYDNHEANLGENSNILGRLTGIAANRGYSHADRIEKIEQTIGTIKHNLNSNEKQYARELLEVSYGYLTERGITKSRTTKLKRKTTNLVYTVRKIKTLEGELSENKESRRLPVYNPPSISIFAENEEKEDEVQETGPAERFEKIQSNIDKSNSKRSRFSGFWKGARAAAAAAVIVGASFLGCTEIGDSQYQVRKSAQVQRLNQAAVKRENKKVRESMFKAETVEIIQIDKDRYEELVDANKKAVTRGEYEGIKKLVVNLASENQDLKKERENLTENFNQHIEQSEQNMENAAIEIARRGMPDKQVRAEATAEARISAIQETMQRARKEMVNRDVYNDAVSNLQKLGEESKQQKLESQKYRELSEQQIREKNKEIEGLEERLTSAAKEVMRRGRPDEQVVREVQAGADAKYAVLEEQLGKLLKTHMDLAEKYTSEVPELKNQIRQSEEKLASAAKEIERRGKPDNEVKAEATAAARKNMVPVKNYENALAGFGELNKKYELKVKGFEKVIKTADAENKGLKEKLIAKENEITRRGRPDEQVVKEVQAGADARYQGLEKKFNDLKTMQTASDTRYNTELSGLRNQIKKSEENLANAANEIKRRGKPDNEVRAEATAAVRQEYGQFGEKIEKLRAAEARAKEEEKQKTEEGKKIHSLVSHPAFTLPEFPLAWSNIKLTEEKGKIKSAEFGSIYVSEYLHQNGLGVIDTKQELKQLAAAISRVYSPGVVNSRAFEMLAEATGTENLAKELEAGVETPTDYDRLAEFIFAYQNSLEREKSIIPLGVFTYRDAQGELIAVGNQESLIKLKAKGN